MAARIKETDSAAHAEPSSPVWANPTAIRPARTQVLELVSEKSAQERLRSIDYLHHARSAHIQTQKDPRIRELLDDELNR